MKTIRPFFAAFVAAIITLLSNAPLVLGDVYQWNSLSGLPGGYGNADGIGSAARFNSPSGVTVDGSGNIYVADTESHTIRKITSAGMVTRLAGAAGSDGSPGQFGSADGTGSAARFHSPSGLAVDGSGNIYVADTVNNTVRKITTAGVVTTLAGTAGLIGSADGTGSAARFQRPSGVAVDGSGNVYVADTYNHTIRKITSTGVVTTLAGLAGIAGSADGTGNTARFNYPLSVAVVGSGDVYVADTSNHTIRKITSGGVVTTLAGVAGSVGSLDGTGSDARFDLPSSVAVDGSGNIYVADTFGPTVRKITSGGLVTTLAGTAGQIGSADGTGGDARFNWPRGVTVDGSGNVYVAESFNTHIIRKITSAGFVTTLAGLVESPGSADGTPSGARFFNPSGVVVDGSGNAYVADTTNHTIRKITSDGLVTTLAGIPRTFGSTDGAGSAARFYFPSGVAVDGSGNIYVADTSNHTVRKITNGGVVTTLAGAAGVIGSADGTGSTARFNYPSGVTVDGSGNVYVADTANHTIRKITSGGVVTTMAGLAGSSGGADGTPNAARFFSPSGVAVDGSGNIYVADTSNDTIRKITSEGVVTTLAGSVFSPGSTDGTGSNARFEFPRSVAVDSNGNIYVADERNDTIRKVTSGGVVTTLAGSAGSQGSTDGTGGAARFNSPRGVAVGGGSNIYVADNSNHNIRKITGGGVVTTLAGLAGSPGNADGTNNAALFDRPYGVAVDGSGTVYVGDTSNLTIRKITSSGEVTTLAGTAGQSGSADGTGNAARFNSPYGVAVDGIGNVYVADDYNNNIRKITSGGVVTTLAGLAGNPGSADGAGSAARFQSPHGVAVDGSANIYVADSSNHTIRKITSAGVVTTLAGLAGTPGISDGTGSAARFVSPKGVAVDGSSNVYVSDGFNTIRKITGGGVVTTLAGSLSPGSTDGTGSAARFSTPYGLAADGNGNVYVADQYNQIIRKITNAGVVTTIGGTAGVVGGTDGLGRTAQFSFPSGIAVSSNGTLFVADTWNNRISKGVSAANPLSAWKLAYLGDVNAPDTGNLDGDGLVNLAEYALVRSPTTPDPFPVRVDIFPYSEGQRLRLFLERDPARNDVTVTVEATGDLIAGPWTPIATSTLGAFFAGPGYFSGDGEAAGVRTVEVRDVANFSSVAQRFLRVKITH